MNEISGIQDMENLEIGRTERGDPVVAAGALDVANVLCNRVHPGQRDLYRGDTGYVTLLQLYYYYILLITVATNLFCRKHMLNLQCIVGLAPLYIHDVCITLGHNNDQGTFNVTRTGELLQRHNVILLADGAYHDRHIIHTNAVMPVQWYGEHRSLRSLVEKAFSYIQGKFNYLKHRSRLVPEKHAVAIVVCAQIVALDLQQNEQHILLPQIM